MQCNAESSHGSVCVSTGDKGQPLTHSIAEEVLNFSYLTCSAPQRRLHVVPDADGMPTLDTSDAGAPEKMVWPELVGKLADQAKEDILREYPNLKVRGRECGAGIPLLGHPFVARASTF